MVTVGQKLIMDLAVKNMQTGLLEMFLSRQDQRNRRPEDAMEYP